MTDKIRIEVCYALRDHQELLSFEVREGSSVMDVIRASGLLTRYPDINFDNNKVGVFSRLVSLDSVVRDQDRVEIYRPLVADPKEVRRQRAAEGKAMKKGGGPLIES